MKKQDVERLKKDINEAARQGISFDKIKENLSGQYPKEFINAAIEIEEQGLYVDIDIYLSKKLGKPIILTEEKNEKAKTENTKKSRHTLPDPMLLIIEAILISLTALLSLKLTIPPNSGLAGVFTIMIIIVFVLPIILFMRVAKGIPKIIIYWAALGMAALSFFYDITIIDKGLAEAILIIVLLSELFRILEKSLKQSYLGKQTPIVSTASENSEIKTEIKKDSSNSTISFYHFLIGGHFAPLFVSGFIISIIMMVITTIGPDILIYKYETARLLMLEISRLIGIILGVILSIKLLKKMYPLTNIKGISQTSTIIFAITTSLWFSTFNLLNIAWPQTVIKGLFAVLAIITFYQATKIFLQKTKSQS